MTIASVSQDLVTVARSLSLTDITPFRETLNNSPIDELFNVSSLLCPKIDWFKAL